MEKQIRFKILFALIAFALLIPQSGLAQRWKLRRYDVGFGVGTTQIFGDIGGAATEENLFGLKDIKFDETRLAFSTHMRYKVDPRISINVNLNGGMGHGTDENSTNERGRSYDVKFGELSAQVEYYFIQEDKMFRSAAMYNKRGMLNNFASIAVYGFAGGGSAFSIASHDYGNGIAEFVDDYKGGLNIVPVVFVGLGARYVLDEKSFIGAELGYRYCITDYIEGYSNKVWSDSNDIYYLFMVSYNYRLKTTRRNLPAFIDRKYSRFGY